MATRCQIWRLDNLLGPGQLHEVVLGADGQPIFVNTAFSCLAKLAPGCSFAPTWQPPFITKLVGDDRCHLNGLALKDDVPTWASACGGGVLIHIPTGELAATGLSMPHSPRWHDGKLWLLNSGTASWAGSRTATSTASVPCQALCGDWPLPEVVPWWGSPSCVRPSSPACRWRSA
jgi:uncharacterized protein (TIGR03032 family)